MLVWLVGKNMNLKEKHMDSPWHFFFQKWYILLELWKDRSVEFASPNVLNSVSPFTGIPVDTVYFWQSLWERTLSPPTNKLWADVIMQGREPAHKSSQSLFRSQICNTGLGQSQRLQQTHDWGWTTLPISLCSTTHNHNPRPLLVRRNITQETFLKALSLQLSLYWSGQKPSFRAFASLLSGGKGITLRRKWFTKCHLCTGV